MNKNIIGLGALIGGIAVILGAYGAHGLKAFLSETQLISFETGVRYQLLHALFLLFIGSTSILNKKSKKIICYLSLLGILIFSGSIYLLSTNHITPIDFKFLGPITPIGGFLLISAWFLLAYSCFFSSKQEN